MMHTYLGVKLIKAEPLDHPATDTIPAKEGYRVIYEDGYESWSPKSVFEEAYRPINGMNFGLALEALKVGKKVARTGWNGKGMWLSLSGPAEGRRIGNELFWSKNNAQYAAEQPDCCATVLPCITMKTATGEILMGWLASQTDMLAEDWRIVE